jgi:hypothetical protein
MINLQSSGNKKDQTIAIIDKNDEELATISYSQTSSEYASAGSIQLEPEKIKTESNDAKSMQNTSKSIEAVDISQYVITKIICF